MRAHGKAWMYAAALVAGCGTLPHVLALAVCCSCCIQLLLAAGCNDLHASCPPTHPTPIPGPGLARFLLLRVRRRFQPVFVNEPDEAQTLAILRGLRSRYERHHRCVYSEEALEAAVQLSHRYVADRFLPDKVR